MLVESGEDAVEDALTSDLTLGDSVVALQLESGSELGGGNKEGA
jgi:hypothetical protein